MQKHKPFIIITPLVLLLFMGLLYADQKNIKISGKTQGWYGTGMCFEKGDKMVLKPRGTIEHSWASGYNGPEGNPGSLCGNSCKPLASHCNVGALVGRIGSGGSAQCVDGDISTTVSNSGELFLGINDMPVQDNEGSFYVDIKGGKSCESEQGGW